MTNTKSFVFNVAKRWLK